MPASESQVQSGAMPASTTREDPLVRFSGVKKHFGTSLVLRGLDLTIGKAEFLTLLGPSGCGKTTTLRILAGFEQPDEGRVFVSGKDITDIPPHRRDIHTVFQHYALFPHYDVFENVAFGLRLRRVPEPEVAKRVSEALAMVKLQGYERRRTAQLSGGQMQRVAVARALVGHPILLLLDEPLGALDLKLRKAMQLELRSLQRRLGMTFVYVTHDQEEAMAMSDRIAVMNNGQVEQIGSPEEIYARPKTAFVADFIGAANILKVRLSKILPWSLLLRLSSGVEFELRHSGEVKSVEQVPLSVAIRPEKIHILEGDGGPAREGFLRVRAVVSDVVYLGGTSQVFLTLESEEHEKLMVLSSNGQAGALKGPGSAVWIEVALKDVLALNG